MTFASITTSGIEIAHVPVYGVSVTPAGTPVVAAEGKLVGVEGELPQTPWLKTFSERVEAPPST